MFILLNKKANSGKAARKWDKVKSHIYDRFYAAEVFDDDETAERQIKEALEIGETEFISAGGDGTLNFLINILVKNSSQENLKNVKVGAIGLGSSNDFQKPFNEVINSIPVRIDNYNYELSDIGVLEYEDEENKKLTKYWIINSSIGILADANGYFNHCGQLWGYFKRHFVEGAIIYSALQTILRYRNKNCFIATEESERRNIEISNIGITKNPNFAGDFSYPVSFNPSSGLFNVHILEKTNLINLVLTLFRLWNNKNKPVMNIQTDEADSFEVSSECTFSVEYDGEVISTKKVKFSIMNKAINLCR